MGDKPGGAKKLDLTPLFFLFLIVIVFIIGNPTITERTVGGKDNLGGGCFQPEPKMITDDVDTTDYEYTVVVECYQVKKDAYWAAGRLRVSQVNNFVMEHKGAWHVCVGKYFSRKQAQRQVAVLKKHGVSNPVIFPPGKSECVQPEKTIVTIDYTRSVLIATVIIIVVIAIAALTKKSDSPPPKKCEVATTTTTTTVTKTEIKDP